MPHALRSYRCSFFAPERLAEHGVALASALAAGQRVPVRNPHAVRPWQHVLEPLSGYLRLGAQLMGAGTATRAPFCAAWNFGPGLENAQPVARVVGALIDAWGGGGWDDVCDPTSVHEAAVLRLAIEKACCELGWAPYWGFSDTIGRTAAWYRAHHEGLRGPPLRDLTLQQIREYSGRRGGV